MSHYIACFFGGVFFPNTVPNLVQDMSGRTLPTPFLHLLVPFQRKISLFTIPKNMYNVVQSKARSVRQPIFQQRHFILRGARIGRNFGTPVSQPKDRVSYFSLNNQ